MKVDKILTGTKEYIKEYIRDYRVVMVAILACLTVLAGIMVYVDPTGQITGRPEAVERLAQYDTSYDTVSLRWKPSKRAQYYDIYRSDSKRFGYEKVGTVEGNKFTDEGLQTDAEYWYDVRAVNRTRKSGKGKVIPAKPQLETPEFTVKSLGDGVHIQLEETPGADGYVIYRDNEAIAKGDGLEYLDDDTKAGDRNEYTAKAYRKVEDEWVTSSLARGKSAAKANLEIELKNFEEVPELIKGDDSYVLKGNVESNATIASIEVGVKKVDGDEWVSKKTTYENKAVNKKNFDIEAADKKVKMDSLDEGEYKLVITAKTIDGTERTVKEQDFVVRDPTGGEMIAQVAVECAWPYGTPLKQYKYSGGSRTDAYTGALDQAYGSRKNWSKQCRAGASCDVFVGAVVRVAGADDNFPRGLDAVPSHCKKNQDKWNVVDRDEASLMPGDVIYQRYKSGAGHICVYLGDGKVAEAHYIKDGGTYAVISDYSRAVKSASRCREYNVYRTTR